MYKFYVKIDWKILHTFANFLIDKNITTAQINRVKAARNSVKLKNDHFTRILQIFQIFQIFSTQKTKKILQIFPKQFQIFPTRHKKQESNELFSQSIFFLLIHNAFDRSHAKHFFFCVAQSKNHSILVCYNVFWDI